MKELLPGLVEQAKKSRKDLTTLKNIAVKGQQFQLAAEFRDLINKFFPETQEEIDAKKAAKDIGLALRMVELNVPDDVCWLISQTLKVHSKMKGKFSVKEAAMLISKHRELFSGVI
jgi:hypothetical protein